MVLLCLLPVFQVAWETPNCNNGEQEQQRWLLPSLSGALLESLNLQKVVYFWSFSWPAFQVEEIQEGLLSLLHTQYRNLTIHKGYLESEEEEE